MTDEQKAAFLQSQSACAMIEAMGMQAENQRRIYRNESLAYDARAFIGLLERYGIHHNAALETLRS